MKRLIDATGLLRRLWGTWRRPIVQKAVLHLGMPKAGSTSIQLALRAAQNSTLARNGIWFTPSNGAFNDAVIYDMLVSEDLDGVRRYTNAKMQAAAAVGADVVIFSAERLFTLDDVETRIAQLARAMRRSAAEVSFVVVIREMPDLLRSYITQMIYNAHISLDDHGLAEWAIDQVGLISESGYKVHLLPLEVQDSDRNIAERLVSEATGRDADIPLARANVTPTRPLVYALTEGLVARIRAIDAGGEINGVEMDEFRTAFANGYDEIMHGTLDPAEVYRVMQRLNAQITEHVTAYIESCLEACPVEKLTYYSDLLAPAPTGEVPPIDQGAVQDRAASAHIQVLNFPDPHGDDQTTHALEFGPRRGVA